MLELLGAALPLAATWLLLRPARAAGLSRTGALALTIGGGLGIASCLFFVALLLFDGRLVGVIGLDVVLLAAAVVVWTRSRPAPTDVTAPRSPIERILAIALLVAALGGATSFVANTLADPHGRWDAWATWNLRARSLAAAGPAWRDVFAKPTVHGDYPLLLPATVARLWVYGGGHDRIAPAAVAAAYGSALVLLLYAALAALRGRAQALIGALCLLGTPLFLRIVPWQYADVPLAFNLLALITLLLLHERNPASGGWLPACAGVAAGLLAWSKNEGMVLVLGVVLVRAALMLVRREPALRAAAWFVAGLLPPGALVLYFKLTLAPLSSQFRQKADTMLVQIADPTRYAAILSAAAAELARGAGPILLALGLYTLLLGRTGDRRARGAAAGVAAILTFAALAYGFTYLTTRAELAWILAHSADRLILQLWPSALLAALLYAASPSEVDAAPAAPPPRRARKR